jgi:hypothetical protein
MLALYDDIMKDNDRLAQRMLCLQDLFFLMVIGCKRYDMNHDWVYARCQEVQDNPDGYLDLWSREHFKMLPLNYSVPTPEGFKNHGDLKKGDYVFGSDGHPVRVVATTQVFHDGECYEIEFNNGLKIKCGADHLWKVGKKSKKRIPGTFIKDKCCGKRFGRDELILSTKKIFAHSHKQDRRLSIDVNIKTILPEKKLLVDPYVLGVWLGDGSKSGCLITGADIEIFNEIERRGYKLGNIFKKPNNKAIGRNILGFMQDILKLGVFILSNSIRATNALKQRLCILFLQALGDRCY